MLAEPGVSNLCLLKLSRLQKYQISVFESSQIKKSTFCKVQFELLGQKSIVPVYTEK